ncbi:response regulator [Pantoea sp. LMR881]|uniref:response regulator n=1 Tax=Pantoea sp. LMR881 TaxID=3014336 RepID=UPI0022AFAAA3|nr:response regulator [Pantoea sp. LMR881]MCZ4059039.1 response regulator [Pantoea sp. LMR881]
MRITTHHFDRLLLARQLQWLGQQAELAADGYEALNLWQKQAFDIIITDCNMPNLNGYQLTRILRESEEEQGRKRAWIIGFTASAMHEVMQLCLEAGMNSCLFKPFSINGLTRALHQSSNGFISATQEADEQAQPEVSDLMDVYMLELMVTTLKEDLAMITQLTLREHRVEVAELAHVLQEAYDAPGRMPWRMPASALKRSAVTRRYAWIRLSRFLRHYFCASKTI